MASSLKDLQVGIDGLQILLDDPHQEGPSDWKEKVRNSVLEIRRIIDELFEPPDLTWEKEKALMLAMEFVVSGTNLGLSREKEHERIARISKATKIIHRADNQEKLNRGLDNLQDA